MININHLKAHRLSKLINVRAQLLILGKEFNESIKQLDQNSPLAERFITKWESINNFIIRNGLTIPINPELHWEIAFYCTPEEFKGQMQNLRNQESEYQDLDSYLFDNDENDDIDYQDYSNEEAV